METSFHSFFSTINIFNKMKKEVSIFSLSLNCKLHITRSTIKLLNYLGPIQEAAHCTSVTGCRFKQSHHWVLGNLPSVVGVLRAPGNPAAGLACDPQPCSSVISVCPLHDYSTRTVLFSNCM